VKRDLTCLLHLVATSAMCGVIWIIQLVHYPAFLYVDVLKATSFEVFHQNAITPIVLPLMLLEVATCGLLFKQGERDRGFLCAGIILAVLWLSTFLIQTPIHQELEFGFNPDLIAKLILTNWIRTLGWSMRMILILRLCLKNFSICPTDKI
jgi:hypothetical protein